MTRKGKKMGGEGGKIKTGEGKVESKDREKRKKRMY